MQAATQETAPQVSKGRRIGFWVVWGLLAFLILGVFQAYQHLQYFVTPWVEAWYAYPGHELHHLAQALMILAFILGLGAQLAGVHRHVGGLLVAVGYVLFVVVGAIGVSIGQLTDPEIGPALIVLFLLTLALYALHPTPLLARFRSHTPPSKALLAGAAVAAVPLIMFAVGSFRLQGLDIDGEHGEFGHWALMGGFGLLVTFTAFMGALRVPGWQLPVWVAGGTLIVYGFASLAVSSASQFNALGAVLAIIWGVLFIVIAQREAHVKGG